MHTPLLGGLRRERSGIRRRPTIKDALPHLLLLARQPVEGHDDLLLEEGRRRQRQRQT